ncbi:hypothetical protein [Paenibacillus sp. SI8]|uniref:hypothetical protein n=1 Tax=unclassified Paenibacillus TaxID=185978 RepID=UPI00346710DC
MYWLILIAVYIILTLISRKKQLKIESESVAASNANNTSGNKSPNFPIFFGYKSSWLAVRTNDTQALLSELNLIDVRQAEWETGLECANQKEIFVTSPIGEWTLVIGTRLLEADNQAITERITPLLLRLSRQFGEACYFGNQRIVGYYAWAKAVNGELIRAYAYLGESGETLWNEGIQTVEETELGFHFFDSKSIDAQNPTYWEREDLSFPDEESVLAIASRWSIDTSALGDERNPSGLGVLGQLQ